MLDDLINYMKKEDITPENQDKIYLVLDTDLNKKRIQDIKSIEKECENRGIRIITSSPTFEIWYLMHYKKENLTFKDSLSVKKELKKIIPDYKETMNIYTKIVEETKTAVENAKLIEKRLKNTADNAYSFTPHSYVYEIIEEINNSNNN